MGILIRLNLVDNRDELNVAISNDERNYDGRNIGSIASFNISFKNPSLGRNVDEEIDPKKVLESSRQKSFNESEDGVIDLTDEVPKECSNATHQEMTDYFIVEKILGSRFNDQTKRHEFLLQLKNCASSSGDWNPPPDPQSFDLCDPDSVLYVQRSEDLVAPQRLDPVVDEVLDSIDLEEVVPKNSADELESTFENKPHILIVDSPERPSEVVLEESEEKLFRNAANSSEREECKVFDEVPPLPNESKLKCKICGLSFESEFLWRKHYRRCSAKNSQSFPCSDCPRTFSALRYLKKHSKIHSHNTVYRCSLCGYTYGNPGHLKLHEKQVHSVRYQRKCLKSATLMRKRIRKPIKIQARIECSVCQNTFDKKTYNLHPCARKVLQPLACTQCDQTFLTKVLLEKHKLSHSQFRCSVCNRVFKAFWRLQMHEQSHEKGSAVVTNSEPIVTLSQQSASEVPYCSSCNQYFSSKAAALVHQQVVHSNQEGSSEKCMLCGMVLKSKQCLLVHMYRHTDERRYKCQFCDYKTIQPGPLINHMRTRHGVSSKKGQ